MALKNSWRAALSDGTPVSRPRARLMVGRSSGRPSRLLRRASVTNSSISLPVCRVMPRTMAPAAWSALTVTVPVPLLSWLNASGLRKASISPMELSLKFGSKRSTVSVSIEWPKRYTTWANSATIAGLILVS
ncbi:hypothetical protein D3C84_564340 [compost metagenome]